MPTPSSLANAAHKDAIDHANRVIGDKRICGIRDGKKARFFIADELRGEPVVTEVSGHIARVTDTRRNNDGWVCPRNICGDPCNHLLEIYDELMGREHRPNLVP